MGIQRQVPGAWRRRRACPGWGGTGGCTGFRWSGGRCSEKPRRAGSLAVWLARPGCRRSRRAGRTHLPGGQCLRPAGVGGGCLARSGRRRIAARQLAAQGPRITRQEAPMPAPQPSLTTRARWIIRLRHTERPDIRASADRHSRLAECADEAARMAAPIHWRCTALTLMPGNSEDAEPGRKRCRHERERADDDNLTCSGAASAPLSRSSTLPFSGAVRGYDIAVSAIYEWATPDNLQPEPVTVEIWRNLPEEYCRQVEIVNGQVVRCAAPTRAHQNAVRRLTNMVEAAAEGHMAAYPGECLDLYRGRREWTLFRWSAVMQHRIRSADSHRGELPDRVARQRQDRQGR